MALEPHSAYSRVLYRAFRIAGATGELSRPVHLLASLSKAGGPISEALTSPGDGLLPGHADDPADRGGGASYLLMQTQQAAHRLASERGVAPGPEHLFLAVLDQAEPEAMALLHRPASIRASCAQRPCTSWAPPPTSLRSRCPPSPLPGRWTGPRFPSTDWTRRRGARCPGAMSTCPSGGSAALPATQGERCFVD
ncbi:MAG: hypothetical protein ACRDY0_09895 [Acidimicrobiales bacterium]